METESQQKRVIAVDFRKAKLTETWTVNRSRKANDELRGKRHLHPHEVEAVCKWIRSNSRYPERDEAMVLVALHHGFRVGELVALKWQHIDFKGHQIAVKRSKNGIDTQQPLSHAREIRLLRQLYKEQEQPTSGFVFLNERGSPVTVNGFQKMFSRMTESALGKKWNPHALRHACATTLLDKGHDLRTVQVYLGHANVQNTVIYLHSTTRQFSKIEW